MTAPSVPAGPCPNADVMPAAGNIATVRDAVNCLVNKERVGRGLRALAANSKLQSAATAYSQRMVAEDFFAHVAPDGSDLQSRILGVGYVSQGDSYSLGENIAWGTGTLATPTQIVQAWMQSPGHRANILTAGFEESGIGVAIGIPVTTASGAGATFTQDFGSKG